MTPLSRRTFLIFAGVATTSFAACRRGPAQERCPHCGMLVDRNSPFRTELNGAGYDAPRCALAALRSGTTGPLRVQEFYTRAWTDGGDVRYVAGSDVEGPMAAELVPVAADKVDKFMRDHHGQRVYRLEEVTSEVLKKEGAP